MYHKYITLNDSYTRPKVFLPGSSSPERGQPTTDRFDC